MSSSVDKTKETKKLDGVEAIASAPDKIKNKIIADSIKEEDKTSQNMIKIMRNKIVQSENSVVIESHEWEALYKMFQVLQIQSKDSGLDDDTLNIIQNMCTILKLNLKFTDDGTCVPIDFSDYEGDDIEIQPKPSTELKLSDDTLADLFIVMDEYDKELAASVKRINPAIHAKLEKLTGDKLDSISKIDNCISLLVTIQYFDIDMSESIRSNLRNIIDDLNDFVREHTKETKKFYKKFKEIDNKEEYTMAVKKRGSQREIKSMNRAVRQHVEHHKKISKLRKRGEELPERHAHPGAYEREDNRGRGTHERNMEKLARLKEQQSGKPVNRFKKKDKNKDDDKDTGRGSRSRRDRDDDRDRDRSSRSSREDRKENKKDNREMDMDKTLKKVRKEFKDDLKDMKLLNDLDDLISDGNRLKEKDLNKFLKDVKEEDKKIHKEISKMVEDLFEDDSKSSRRSKRDDDDRDRSSRGKGKSSRSRRDRDDEDDDRKSSRSKGRGKRDKDDDDRDDRRGSRSSRGRRDRDRDDDRDDRRSSRGKGKRKKGGSEMLDNLDIELDDVIDIVSDIMDEHGKEIKKFSKDIHRDLKDVLEDLEDGDDETVNKALALLFILGMNIKVKKSILKSINKTFKLNDDEDEDDDRDSRRSSRSRRDRDDEDDDRRSSRGKSRKSRKDDDMVEVKEVLEDIIYDYKKLLKEEKLLSDIEDIIDDIDDDRAKMKDIVRLHEDICDIKKLKKDKLVKKLANLIEEDDDRSSRGRKDRDRDDDRDDRRSSRGKSRKSRKSEFALIGDLLADIVDDFEDELYDARLLKDTENMIDDIKDDEVKKKDIIKLVKELKRERDLEDAKKIIKKIEKELNSDEDEDDDRRSSRGRRDRDRDDDRDDRRSSRSKGRSRRDRDDEDDDRSSRKKGKRNKIDFDDIEPRKRDLAKIEDAINDSDLEKKDRKTALKYMDKEDWEALYDLASDEDKDLASDLKEIFRGLAREVDSDSDYEEVKGYFGKDFEFIDKDELDDIKFEVVSNIKDLAKLDLDENDSKFKEDFSKLVGMSMGDMFDMDEPKFNKNVNIVVIFSEKTATKASRKNVLTAEDMED